LQKEKPKIAHSQKSLKKHVPDELLEDTYWTEEALTFSLMGLMAEETIIAQRLGFLGKKKQGEIIIDTKLKQST
jgi:hypothetical protein